MDIIKRLFGLMAPYKKKIVLAMLLQLTVIVTRLIAPLITRSIIADVIQADQKSMTLLAYLCIALLLLVLVRGLCTYIRSLALERVSQNVVFNLRTGLYRHMGELPYQFYDHHRIGDIMSRMTGDIEGIRNLISGGLVTVFDNSLNFIGSFIFLMVLAPKLMLLESIITARNNASNFVDFFIKNNPFLFLCI